MMALFSPGLARHAAAFHRALRARLDRQPHPTIRPGELAARLASSTHTHIAFDIFDTLLARTITPEHVKMLASDRLCRLLGWTAIDGHLLYQVRREAERDLCLRSFGQHEELEFRFAELADEMLERLVARGVSLSHADRALLTAAMLDCELAVERSVLQPIGATIDALNLARSLRKKIVFVSDFYLNKESVVRLLEPFVSPAACEALFVSSDHMASKRSGRLYQVVCAELNISPSNLMMIGDNPHSDYAQARAMGIDAVLLCEPERVAFYKSRAASVVYRPFKNAALRDVLMQSGLSDSRNLRAIVPSLYLFIERLYSTARRSGLRDLCFLAREGEPLRTMFDIYQDLLGCSDSDRIRTHYLLVSRRSCYAPSLRSLESESFEGIFRYYSRMSVRDFLQSLGFRSEQIELLNAEIKTNFDDAIDNFRTSDVFNRLRGSSLFRRDYEEHRHAQRAHLQAYMNGLGIPFGEHPLVLVDVGWKGSIQDYLRAAMPGDVQIRGYYFGLLNVGQPLDDKTGLVLTNVPHLSPFYRTYSENRTLFELLLCADHGSALRYEGGPDGRTNVILDNDADELAYIRNELLPLRDDVLAAFREFCLVRNRFCPAQGELEIFAARAHAGFVFRPWRRNAQLLALAQHRENFGSFATSKYSTHKPLTLRNKWRFWRRLVRSPRATLIPSFWPALTLLQYTNRLVTRIYAACRRAQDYRMGGHMTAWNRARNVE